MNGSRPTEAIDPYAQYPDVYEEPPKGFGPTFRHLGPGMILVGAIVGSGELIMTTKLGAVVGFSVLWFVIVSCVIKAVVQAELARHTISSGETFLETFNKLPGPRGRRPMWLTLGFVCVMALAYFCGFLSQGLAAEHLGDRVGLYVAIGVIAVGALALAVGRRVRVVAQPVGDPAPERPELNWFMWFWMLNLLILFLNGGAVLGGAGQALQIAFPDLFGEGGARYWTIFIAVLCAVLLLGGRYAFLERVSIGLVTVFTLITLICTFLLQFTGYSISLDDLQRGFTFELPILETAGVLLLLGMYANTGVTGPEMISYTYWCLEKGYARNTGANQPGAAWAARARGWIRVMYTDVLLTMVVYTVGTICFFFLGAAILHPQHLDPDGIETLEVLGGVYTETLGTWATTLFVVGSFFVLFSTVFSNVASNSRIVADGLGVMRLIDRQDFRVRMRFIRVFIIVSLILFVAAYWAFQNPPLMIIITSMASAVLYPTLGLGALYLRRRRLDPRILPGRATTFWLRVCALAVAIISPSAVLIALVLRLTS